MKMTGIEKVILGAIVVIVLLLVISVGVFVVSLGWAVNEIDEKGLKGVTEEIWHGSGDESKTK